jgi:hypothetical protein
MAKKPRSVEIRSYQVGFGDCFLLSFVYGEKDKRHVLIDFGTTALPLRGRDRKPAKASDHMPAVARDIAAVCGGRLTAVVASHRHADHISGFATDPKTGGSGLIIKGLKPKVVLQPWTEDPDARTDARKATSNSSRSAKAFTAGLAAMHDVAAAVYRLAQSPPAWMGPSLQKELSFLGEDNIRNESAVRNLMAMGSAKGARAVWAHHGSPSGLERLLPGVKVRVLGPPDLTQTEKIKKQRSKDPDEFWHFLSGTKAAGTSDALERGIANGRRRGGTLPPEARWFSRRLDRLRGEQLLQIVRTLDDQMNNTSLILLFEVGPRKLLFPGDAQLENWSYALQDDPGSAATCKLLAEVDVYKVGHHGSLNATPKKLLWDKFARRKKAGPGRLCTLMSTMPGKHGKVKNRTEVPRRPLVDALEKESDLTRTDTLKFGAAPELCHKTIVDV